MAHTRWKCLVKNFDFFMLVIQKWPYNRAIFVIIFLNYVAS